MRKRWLIVAFGVALTLALAAAVVWRVRKVRSMNLAQPTPAPVGSARAPTQLDVAEILYEGKLGQGWDDWGWGEHRLGNGPAQIVFSGYGGILFHHAQLASRFGGMSFRYRAPAEWGEFMHVTLAWAGVGEEAFPVVNVEPRHIAVVDGWREVLIDWKELNPERRPFDRVRIGSRSMVGSDPVLIERVVLTRGTDTSAPSGKRTAKLRVRCDKPSQRINSLIYGNSTDDWASGQSAKRIGGNTLTRLNWELGFYNVGRDWFFENAANKTSFFESLDAEAKEKRPLALVVPLIGWVAKDGTSVGFPRSKFPSQQKFDPYKAEAGNGLLPDEKPIVPGDPSLTSVPAPPELIEKWVRKLVEQNIARGSRGVSTYILDNEPALWNSTHRDVHPNPVGYDELMDRTIKYASAIRRADPEGLIAGPAEWGWPAFFASALDRENKTDRAEHGNEPLVTWYLKRLAAHEKATGTRLLDVFDLHFYPQGQGVFADGGAAKDEVTAELRLRSTRALWDPSYFDESWIREAVRLIPRMKDWVRESYPGTKISIGEWSFGAEDHISGGLATAEALGRFGQQGLDSAYHWGDLKEAMPAFWAFRAFRNYDGKGARFGDESLATEEGDQVSLFASRDAQNSKLIFVLINRSAQSEVAANIELQSCGDSAAPRLFGFAEGAAALKEGKATLVKGALEATLAPFSFAVLELTLASAAGAAPSAAGGGSGSAPK